MKIDDRSLSVCYVVTHFLTHAAKEGFHNDHSAVRQHCAPTVL
jgi:hypothetical protein